MNSCLTPLWNPLTIADATHGIPPKSGMLLKSKGALAALYQHIKVNDNFLPTTNLRFSGTDSSCCSLSVQLLSLQIAQASSLSFGNLPGVSGPNHTVPHLPHTAMQTTSTWQTSHRPARRWQDTDLILVAVMRSTFHVCVSMNTICEISWTGSQLVWWPKCSVTFSPVPN